ncbi:MAG: hypothetical protein ACI91Z_000043 [Yoonia sp.]|jgi:hypothetical protein
MDSGDALQVNLDGVGATAVRDTTVTIFDRNGNEVAFNDDSGGLFSEVTFTATHTGDYFIAAGSYIGAADSDDSSGDYRITTTQVAAPPPADPLDSIGWGTALADTDQCQRVLCAERPDI